MTTEEDQDVAALVTAAEARGFTSPVKSMVTVTSMSEVMSFCEMACRTNMVPKGYRGKPESALVAVQFGIELGLSPMQALQGIAEINGKPGVYGDTGRALVQSHREFEDIQETVDDRGDQTHAVARCVIKRRGRSAVVEQFSVADAKTARLWGKQGPWTDYPMVMLGWRAFWFAARKAFPDALRGVYGYEELVGGAVVDGDDVPVTAVPASPAAALTDKLRSRADAEADGTNEVHHALGQSAKVAGFTWDDLKAAMPDSVRERIGGDPSGLRDLTPAEAGLTHLAITTTYRDALVSRGGSEWGLDEKLLIDEVNKWIGSGAWILEPTLLPIDDLIDLTIEQMAAFTAWISEDDSAQGES